MQRILTATAAIALMTGAAFAQDEEATPVEITEAVATFVDMEGAENGTASLTGTPNGVLIQIEVSGLPAGEWLAFHVHETGECDAATHHD